MGRVIVYHDNCHDGITALWCALQKWPDAEPYPGKYDVPPDLERLRDKDVAIVDFSWKRAAMSAVRDVASSLLVLDHHKTAEEELRGFNDGFESDTDLVVFDMERSGAGLAWDYLVGGDRPPLISFVEDRDLWRFELPKSREVHAACGSYPLTLEARSRLMETPILQLMSEGTSILRYHDRLVEETAKNAVRGRVGSWTVPVIHCPTIAIASDLGHRLAQGEPFAAIYTEREDGTRVYQLRSTPEGEDVSEIARLWGGGGHRNAAGFTAVKGSI